jgi:hypothetical protein
MKTGEKANASCATTGSIAYPFIRFDVCHGDHSLSSVLIIVQLLSSYARLLPERSGSGRG